MCTAHICVHWPWTQEAVSPQTHPPMHTHTAACTHWSIGVTLFLCFTSLSAPCFPSTLGYVVVFQAGISPASPGEESRAWGWARPQACWLSLSITLSQPLRSSALLTAVILLSPTWGKLLNACVFVRHTVHTIKYMLMYKRAEVQTHTLFADAYSTTPHKTHTQTRYTESKKTKTNTHTPNHTGARTMVVVCCIRQEVSGPIQSCFCQTKGLLLHS